MAIALVQSNSGLSTTATTNPSFSVAPTNGNLIVLAFSSDDYNGTPDTGWTQSTGMEQQTFHGAYVWWRISTGANPPGGYTIGSATTSSWVLAEFSGCDASPYDVSQGTFLQSSATTMATSTITPTTGNRVLVAMVGGSSSVASLAGAYDSWTNSFTAIVSTGQTAGAATCTGLAYRLVTGNGSTTFNTTADYPGAVTPQTRSGLIISFKEGAGGGTTLTAAGGSYALTGTSAGVGGRAIADPGSYALTGTAATFAFKFAAEAAVSSEGLTDGSAVNFVITGAPVTLTALGGSYTLTGTSAGVGGKAILDPGSYGLTGTAMTWRLTAPATSGAYALTGTAATFLRGMTAGNSGYTVNGTDATFLITSGSYTLFCNSGSYALTGRDAAFPGNEPIPPVQPSTGGGYTGGAVYDTYRLRKKRKREEIEELIDAVIQAPPIVRQAPLSEPQPPPPALVDLLPKMQAVGLTPPQQNIVKRAVVSDDPDDDDEAIELLLTLLS
jgi:hypothetical protein